MWAKDLFDREVIYYMREHGMSVREAETLVWHDLRERDARGDGEARKILEGLEYAADLKSKGLKAADDGFNRGDEEFPELRGQILPADEGKA